MTFEEFFNLKSIYDINKGRMVRFSAKRELKKNKSVTICVDDELITIYSKPIMGIRL